MAPVAIIDILYTTDNYESLCFLLFPDSKLGAAEVWTSRQALQDLYQKMLVTDLEYALDKKVEQDL